MTDPFCREQVILIRYSTPGLRKSELTRQAKKEHLQGFRLPADDIENLLLELYP